MPLTPEAKSLLAGTIRSLRTRLLRDLHDEADRRYRLSVPIVAAGLDEAHRRRRERVEAWVDEQARATKPKSAAELKSAKARLLAQAEKEAAATLINRLVLMRHLEALGLSKPAVLTGGWSSKGYREFRASAPALLASGTTDETEGYEALLQLLFDELAIDLPGLFGDVGLTRLFPIPASTLREVVERLDAPDLLSAWTDDTTLGWVYQYWNDPDREALDAKIASGGKIQPHEIASKTQMFTERYMVEWLLQNSLGLTWLCMCRKHGWAADAEKVLPALEARRVDWRRRRDAGEVALDALMPIEGELEDHWKYFVPQQLPDDAVDKAPDSVRSLKILDPACGSGHFLVIAFGLLTALYREEARHRGEAIGDREIAESILENNLHGIDIDPRAIQIAAAALHLKAKSLAKDARPKTLNLVAPVFQLGNLSPDDPAVVQLRDDLRREAGIPEALTDKLLKALAGVDFLGSLLKVDATVEKELQVTELEFERVQGQGSLFGGLPAQQVKLSLGEARASVLDKLETFLAKHSKVGDLGLRLDGEQLAAGVRFVRMVREGTYDVVVGNPPYHTTSKLAFATPFVNLYPEARADVFAAFYIRALEMTRPGGLCGYVTLSNWMFLGAFERLRKRMLREGIMFLADFGKGAFSQGSQLITTSACLMTPGYRGEASAFRLFDRAGELAPNQADQVSAALLAQAGRYTFDPRSFEVIVGEPIVYWWSKKFLKRYGDAPKLGATSPVRQGAATSDNGRFLRRPWEIARGTWSIHGGPREEWASYTKGAAGKTWIESVSDLIAWRRFGLEVKTYAQHLYGSYTRTIKNEAFYFRRGVAFSPIGSVFSARLNTTAGVFGHMGSSVFADDIPQTLCLMNSAAARFVLESLNPGLHFEVGDVNRLPVFPIDGAESIVATLSEAFAVHVATREPSVEFRRPGPSPWRVAQVWAQGAVDRPSGQPLPTYEPTLDDARDADVVSFAIGITFGRFGADGEGVLSEAPSGALPGGVLFLSAEGSDDLDGPICASVRDAWELHGIGVGEGEDLRTYLRKYFFEHHGRLYEGRPIYFPLSSVRRSFVAWVSIHRWQNDTLNVLLADHLVPARRRLEGEIEDLRTARVSGGNKGKAERRFVDVQKLFEELNDFIAKVTEIAEKGPPPPDGKTPSREVDARYEMDLDDGVMVNSAALWPLLEPQWKDPKKWWKELATAQGKKDYDWSHLAARYFPARVSKKCVVDPSLAVAHKRFWELHPAKAYAWELRLQDEIRPDFTIDEPGSDAARAMFLAEHASEAADIFAAEMKRRARKAAKGDGETEATPLFETDDELPDALES